TASYNDFKKRHIAGVHEQGSDKLCTQEICKRNLTIEKRCKPRNTFIFAKENDVKEVCKKQGVKIINTNLYMSRKPFRIVDCKNADQSLSPPNCIYRAVNANTMMCITVACDKNKLPVHLQKSENVPPVFGITGRV
ncbi:hypothetical protein HHUSO_G33424, partial [Huso huso]